MDIIDYTEKSIVIKGDDTKKFTTQLTELGGKFNRNLKKEDGSNFPGWVFPKSKRTALEELKTNISKGNVKPSETDTAKKTTHVSYEMFLGLVSRVERLEAELDALKGNGNKKKTIVSKEQDEDSEYDEEPEEEVKPTKGGLMFTARKKN